MYPTWRDRNNLNFDLKLFSFLINKKMLFSVYGFTSRSW